MRWTRGRRACTAGGSRRNSVYLNGTRALTVDRLTKVLFNPATGSVTFPSGAGVVNYSTAISGAQAPQNVVQNSSRIVDVFAKAGADLTSTTPDLAQGAGVTASYTASGTSAGAAVDGFPINDPVWGSSGSPNGTDSYELDLRQSRTVDEVRLYFRDDRAGNRYRAPASYNVQYWNGSKWTDAAAQSRKPGVPNANYNVVRFTPVGTQRIRVQMTHASGFKTALTEVKVYHRGGGSDPGPTTNLALTATPSASCTSAWEGVTALNDGIDPPSSNDTVNPRWGTWPNTGEQWAELTWPAAQTMKSAQVYFFDDNGGVRLPASWKLQYWTGTAYADVPGASGHPTTVNQYNQVTFTAVSTTRLRAVLQSGADSVGMLEVKAFG
ncbi:discoidin domain-containing protein [Lentzea albidocapillata]|uniref:F5/8 type C domain-containing protein n=1 Tax=Lentzea albidocapillata TaxID=40571 RepID=A0A1W1ZQ70_9PSEU|nr:discoidin domain-containing protein [Lentzea albidocapillata]SMC50211.1 F5/8 type C domain-containing protein [Lentzea albidocapillata]